MSMALLTNFKLFLVGLDWVVFYIPANTV